MKKALAFLMAAVMLMSMLTACGNKDNADNKDNNDVSTEETDKAAADKVAALIDAIYVQERYASNDIVCEHTFVRISVLVKIVGNVFQRIGAHGHCELVSYLSL